MQQTPGDACLFFGLSERLRAVCAVTKACQSFVELINVVGGPHCDHRLSWPFKGMQNCDVSAATVARRRRWGNNMDLKRCSENFWCEHRDVYQAGTVGG